MQCKQTRALIRWTAILLFGCVSAAGQCPVGQQTQLHAGVSPEPKLAGRRCCVFHPAARWARRLDLWRHALREESSAWFQRRSGDGQKQHWNFNLRQERRTDTSLCDSPRFQRAGEGLFYRTARQYLVLGPGWILLRQELMGHFAVCPRSAQILIPGHGV